MRQDSHYTYGDDGEQIELRPADKIAVDLEAAGTADLPAGVIADLRRQSDPLRGSVVLLRSDDLAAAVVDALESVGALHPVYTSEDGALLVVLPEVRVEVEDEAQAAKLRKHLDKTGSVEVVRDTGELLVLRPTSHRGDDALELANDITEFVDPPLAQARFLRVVPRPGSAAGGPRSRRQRR